MRATSEEIAGALKFFVVELCRFFQVVDLALQRYVVSHEKTMIDEKKLLEYRKSTTVAGVYLAVWKIVEAYLSKNTQLKLEEYVVNFDEDDNSFHVRLSKPFKEPVLGGGIGTCSVDKKTHDVQCKLIR